MGRELNMDTQRQNFWKESINSEVAVRLAWHLMYSKRLNDISKTENKKVYNYSDPKKDVSIRSGDEKLPLIKVKRLEKSHKIKRYEEMRPVSAHTRELLYSGFSALGEGRYAYLQTRKQKKPEQKYRYPMTTGWEYGWNINECMKREVNKPAEFGRTRIVSDSFYRRNGVIPQDGEIPFFL